MKTVLFIGTHNVFRSKYAEAYFNYMASKNRKKGGGKLSDEFHAISKGTYIGQGRLPRFKAIWHDKILSSHHTPHANKLRYSDVIGAGIIIGMYEAEIRPQLFYETTNVVTRRVRGTWVPMDLTGVEYWRIPNLIGTGDCADGSELDDPRDITALVEYNVEMLMDNLNSYD